MRVSNKRDIPFLPKPTSFLVKTDPKASKIPCTNVKKVQGIFVQNSGVVQRGMSRCLGGRRGEGNLLLLYLHRA